MAIQKNLVHKAQMTDDVVVSPFSNVAQIVE